MAILEISLLGTPIIQLDRQPVTFESRKALALLAFLAISGESRQRSELATLLWPESDHKRARGALRYTLSVLQNALGKAWLRSDRETLELRQSDQCRVDAVQFQALLASGRDHAHTPDTVCMECVQQISAAVALYRDDFLTGFSLRDSINFDEWQFFQMEGLRHALANALRQLIRYHTQQADYHEALRHARRLLQLDPLQESVQRTTMQLYAHSSQWELALRQYAECVRLLDAELGVLPSPATTQLYEQIRGQKLGTAPPPTNRAEVHAEDRAKNRAGAHPVARPMNQAARPHNLPAAVMPIVGRQQEIDAVRALLDDAHCRMVTLLGPGGIGKTRLAHQVAIDLCNAPEAHFAHAIYFVPLAAVESADLLVTTIAHALDLTFSGPNAPTEQLRQYLCEQRLLLVLDNFEQLVSSAPLLAELLNAASGIKLLLTSRERLHLHEEWLYEIQGLPLPPVEPPTSAAEIQALAANGAVQLFYQRARRLNPRFVLEESLPSIVQICRMLQGMPLGIELAAGWVRTFSCAEIAHQIQQDLDFLATPLQNVPERHRSLRAAFIHSWRRLTDKERAVFAKAALFRGGFSLDAATSVTQADPLALRALVDKSMVQRTQPHPHQPDRYSIHELLRQYAEEKLEAAERAQTQRQHCLFFARFVADRMPHRSRASEDKALREIGAELENIRAAWNWLIGQVQAVPAENTPQYLAAQFGCFIPMLAHYYLRFSRFAEGQRFFLDAAQAMRNVGWATQRVADWTDELAGELADDLAPDCALRLAQVEARLAEFAFNLSRFQEVVDTYELLLPHFRQAQEKSEIGAALAGLGKAFVRMGRYVEAEPLLQESLSVFRATGDTSGITTALNSLGILYSNQGHFAQARPYYAEFLAIARANQHGRGIANALNNLGSNHARAGEHQKALPLYQESHRLSLVSGERLVIAVALSNLGSASRALGHYADARRYYAESLSICREIGDRRWTAAGLNGLGLTLIESQAHEEAIPHLREALTIAQAIESPPDILDALAALGEAMLHQGDVERATTILQFVANHLVTQTLARSRSQQLLAQMGAAQKAEIDTSSQDMRAIVALL